MLPSYIGPKNTFRLYNSKESIFEKLERVYEKRVLWNKK